MKFDTDPDEVRKRAALAARFVLRSHDHQPHHSLDFWWDYYQRAARDADTMWLVGWGRVLRAVNAARETGISWKEIASLVVTGDET